MTVYGYVAEKELSNSYPDWEQLQEDEQIKVCHHDNCDNGTDHKERFYIINKGGAYLFHCHNCGMDGYYRKRESYAPIADVVLRGKVASTWTGGSVLHVHECAYNNFSIMDEGTTETRLWLAEYEMLGHSAMKHLSRTNQVALPAYDLSGRTYGYQLRNFSKGSGSHYHTKYETYLDHASEGSTLRVSPVGATPAEYLVVVEDLLSAFKLQQAGHDAFALLGTNVPARMPLNYKRAVLWLDKDLAGQKASIDIYRELMPYFAQGVTVTHNDQPKEVPFETLKRLTL